MSSHPQDQARVIPLPPPGARHKEPRAKEPQVQDSQARDSQVREPQAREPLWRHIVGDVLRRERLAQERRLKDVAEAARISMPYLSEIERGRKEASSEVLAAAAHALGLGLADLLGLAQDELAAIAQARRARAQGQLVPGSTRDGAVGCLSGQASTVMPAGRHGAQYPRARLDMPRVEMSLAA